jgi:hypothetical protein
MSSEGEEADPGGEAQDSDGGSAREEIQFNFLSETPIAEAASGLLEWTHKLSPEMTTIVYELLSKQTPTDQMQNELVELLGFENIELTGFLISNRDRVVKAYKEHLIDRTTAQRARKKPTNVLDTTEPAAGRQSKLAGEWNASSYLRGHF